MTHLIIKKRGVSLAETIIYIGSLAILLVAILNGLGTLFVSYKKINSIRSVEQSAISSMDRLTRDIRNSSEIDMINSIFNSNPSDLYIVSNDSVSSSTSRFFVSNGALYVSENSGSPEPLTSKYVQVSNFVLRPISLPDSEAIKIEMTINSVDQVPVEKKFYNTVILRGSYSQ